MNIIEIGLLIGLGAVALYFVVTNIAFRLLGIEHLHRRED